MDAQADFELVAGVCKSRMFFSSSVEIDAEGGGVEFGKGMRLAFPVKRSMYLAGDFFVGYSRWT